MMGRGWIGVGLAVLGWTLLAGTGFEPPADRTGEGEAICVLDLTGLWRRDIRDPRQVREVWDTLHLAASLQGIVNRKGPRLFIRFMAETDDFWFAWCTGESGWLARRPVERFDGIEGLFRLVERFAGEFSGFVSYPEKPFALSNVASTVAGAEGRLAIREDDDAASLYRRFLSLPGRPQDELRLGEMTLHPRAGSCGSPKNDAYRWARERYLDAGRCSAAFMAYYIDAYYLTAPGAGGEISNSTLSNHDFYIANAAFFFDLDVWGDERPNDEPEQPVGRDRETLLGLLKTQCTRAGGRPFIVGGFPPWAWKYADPQHRHDAPDGRRHPVKTEWEYARVLSSYNGIKDADALGYSGLANGSFYRFYPLKARYPQPGPAPSEARLRAAGALDERGRVADRIYLTWYMGDYDAAAWLNRFAPLWWKDPAHGRTMGAWAFDPILAVRVPQAVDYVRRRATANDVFISGDNGFGYLMPSALSAPRLDPSVPDGWRGWVELNREAYQQFDLAITGFIIDPGRNPADRRVAREYAAFSKEGFVYDEGQPAGEARLEAGVPYVRMYTDLYGEPDDASAELAGRFARERGIRFMMVRTILKSPTWHAETTRLLREKMGERIYPLDPRSFFELARRHAENANGGDRPVTAVP
ncbi:MAG: hypothetical protein J6334_12010 [Kiritimatiellae bacterium]|nr:hypothetical protein [Kiritimatiellia bacterium]